MVARRVADPILDQLRELIRSELREPTQSERENETDKALIYNGADFDELAEVLSDQMRHKRSDVNPILELDLRDYIASWSYMVSSRTREQVYVEEYHQRFFQTLLYLMFRGEL